MKSGNDILKSVLESIQYRGYLPRCIFSDKEAGKFLANQYHRDLRLGWEEKSYEKPNLKEIRQEFLGDGVVTEEQAHEMRRKYLMERYKKISEVYFKLLFEDKKIPQELTAKRNRARFDYEIHTYRPIVDKRIPGAKIETARSKWLGTLIKLDARGFAKCPFHNEKTESFKVDRNLYYCFGCGEKGDTIGFVMKQHSCSFREAIDFLCQN